MIQRKPIARLTLFLQNGIRVLADAVFFQEYQTTDKVKILSPSRPGDAIVVTFHLSSA